MSQPRKPRYRTSNWKQYNASLKARGSLTVWLDKGTFERQVGELHIRAAILNRFTELGRPQTAAVA